MASVFVDTFAEEAMLFWKEGIIERVAECDYHGWSSLRECLASNRFLSLALMIAYHISDAPRS